MTTTATRERPILFSAPMVRAILDGRKTQTRRVVMRRGKDEGEWFKARPDRGYTPERIAEEYSCPYGATGDRLWVRETWLPFDRDHIINGERFAYAANGGDEESERCRMELGYRWRPSIHMPRAASRITLEVTGVRVQRLQDIDYVDMKAEGCLPRAICGGERGVLQRDYWVPLWDSINKERGYGWDVNPWVWVIEFKRTEGSSLSDKGSAQ